MDHHESSIGSSLMHAEPKYPAKDVNESFTCFRHAALPISSVLTSNFSRQLALLIKRRLGPMTKDQPFILAAGQGTAASHSIADAIQSTGINTIHFRECQPACKTTVREICEVTDKLELFARQMKHPFRNVSLLEIVSGVLSAFDVALQAMAANRVFALAHAPWTNLFSEFYVALCPNVRVVLSIRDELDWARSRQQGHGHSGFGFVCPAVTAQKRAIEPADKQLQSEVSSNLSPLQDVTQLREQPTPNVTAQGAALSHTLVARPFADPFSYTRCPSQQRHGQLLPSAVNLADIDTETLGDFFEQYNDYVRRLVPAANLLEVNFFRKNRLGAPIVNISAFGAIQVQLLRQFVGAPVQDVSG